MLMPSESDVLSEQRAYYRARAPEYDEWFLRQGRYDRGPEWNRRWFAEVDQLRNELGVFRPAGSVLELAAGTGWWTEHLLRYADQLTAVDASDETLSLNRLRVGEDPRIEYVQADLFQWRPTRTYDVVFFSFWLSHVPPERFDSFWRRVHSALRPNGRVFFIDSARTEASTAANHRLPEPGDPLSIRRLNDGREFRVVKIFYDAEELQEKLADLGWSADVRRTPNFFLFGTATRA
jgi:demethylmenaquinone methyltransferase/2-methoxy-6-polyprenyl-1,4-benzoquinol methylase